MKTGLRRVLNLLLWLNFCLLAGTGSALFWRLPHGEGGGRLSLWGLTRHDWGDVHAYAGMVFAALIIGHLCLAWPWLKKVAAKRKLWPVAVGLLAGLAIAGTLLLGPIAPTHQAENQGNGKGMGWRKGIDE